MAVKTFNTRIKLKYDQNSNWKPASGDGLVLLQGEFGYDSTMKNFFIGDGTTSSKALKYVIGESIMADYVAAPTGITLTDSIANTDSLNIALAKLQNQVTEAAASAGVTNVTVDGTSVVPQNSTVAALVTDTNSQYNASTNALATVGTVTNAIGALDVPSSGDGAITGMGAGKTIASLTETDGKIAATFQNISIIASQISDASDSLVTSVNGDGTYLEPTDASVGAVTISHKERTETAATGTAQNIKVTDDNQSISIITHTFDAAGHETGKTTTAVNFTKITAADLGLSSAMHFIGTSNTEVTDGGSETPTISGWSGPIASGDVVLYDGKEFIWNGSVWELFGDEGSYALNSVSMIAGNGITGGGTLAADRTFAIDIDSTNANGLYLSGSTDGSKQLAIHTATDSQFGTVTATTGNGLTLSSGNLSYAHNTTAVTIASKTGNAITINGTFTPDASDAITMSNPIALADVAATGAASDVSYDHTTSGLTATTVQGAIDEIKTTAAGAVQDVKSIVTTATTAQTPASESVEGTGPITLHKIAKTANPADLIQPSGDLIIFDCGSASVNTADGTGAIAPDSSTPNA